MRPAKSWRLAWKTGRLTPSPSGLTSRPSTVRRGVARWISLQRGSPVPPSPSPASERAPRTSGGSGPKLSGSFARLMPDGSFVKTSGGCCLPGMEEHLPRYSETWPVSGAMSGGVCSERPTWAPRTGGSGSSCWPTATARDYKDTGSLENVPENALLGRVAANWPTATAADAAVRDEMGLDQQARSLLGPPGPSDAAGWRYVLERWPELAPAVENAARVREYGREREDGGRGWEVCEAGDGWVRNEATQPFVRGVADGLPGRVDRLRALGKAVVPQQSAAALAHLWERMRMAP